MKKYIEAKLKYTWEKCFLWLLWLTPTNKLTNIAETAYH